MKKMKQGSVLITGVGARVSSVLDKVVRKKWRCFF